MTFPSGPGQPPLLADDNALFLDVDGTLAELAPRPEAVVVPPAVIADLARLQQRLGGALALLSGRPLDQLGLPAGMKIGAVVRDGVAIMPDETTKLEVGDHVVALVTYSYLRFAEALLGTRRRPFG